MFCDKPHTKRNSRKTAVPATSEEVMKKFYERFKHEHAAFLACFEGIEEQVDCAQYASLLLICTMFVYFIQRKGLLDAQRSDMLDGDCNYLSNRLQMTQQADGRGHFHAFYRAFLLRLFHNKSGSRPGSPEWDELLGNVPYLNSHVFDISKIEREYRAIHIPDEAFERLFGFFDEFEWRLDDSPFCSEHELNPDVIGYIFEKYSNQKQMGAYYTQGDITEYISKNSIIPCLFENIARKCPDLFRLDGTAWTLLRADPERYMYAAVKHGCALPLPLEIEEGVSDVQRRAAWDGPAPREYGLPLETWREVVTRRQRTEQIKTSLANREICSIDDLITYNLDLRQFAQDIILFIEHSEQLAAFYESLEGLTILDPTCGSGAFLFAALAILEPLYVACLERMQQISKEHARQDGVAEDDADWLFLRAFRKILGQAAYYHNSRSFVCRSIIMKNLYGVDLMSEAVEICKLRLFLKSVSQIETLAEIKMLATIDFNIRAGNALVGFATSREVSRIIEREMGGLLFAREMLQQIREQGREIERQFAEDQQLQMEQGLQPELFASNKKRQRALCVELRASLDRYLAAEYGIDWHNISPEEGRAEAFARWRLAFQPFHWMVEWYGIMQNGGFDVIIGNPPYVAYSKVRDIYQVQFYETQSCGNLCAYVLERAATLLRPRGRCGMIVPVSTVACESYRPLSRLLLEKHIWISSYSNRPGKLFTGVEQRLAILLLRNVEAPTLLTSAYRHWYEAERAQLFATLHYTAASTWGPTGMPLKSGCVHAEAVFERLMRQRGFPVLNSQQPGAAVWVHNGPTYWVRALPFEPNTGQKSQRSDHYCKILVASQDAAFVLAAILSSSTFYFFYKLVSNCRDLGQKELHLFPLGQLQPASEARLVELGRLLAQRLKDTAERRTRRYTSSGMVYEVSYEEYYPARARALLDEIDRILAGHYGFSDEELDFLLHYNSKYRRSREGVPF